MKSANYYRAEIRHNKYSQSWTVDVVARTIPEAVNKLSKIMPPIIGADTGDDKTPYTIDSLQDKGKIYL